MRVWTNEQSAELYGIQNWGREFLRINELGHLVVAPEGETGPSVDLRELVDDLQKRGIGLPMLLRFPDLLRVRMRKLADAFQSAIKEYGYQGQYRGVYPVKVNQQRHVVEDVVSFAAPHHIGLEAGSKPELLIVLAMLDDPEAIIVCNGYKDEEYIETAMSARKLGRNTIIVIEKASEIKDVVNVSRRIGVRPVLGVRAKLASRGAGHWEDSTGDRAKFGLTVEEMVDAVERLRAEGMLDCLQMLHFHIGSQVSAIRSFKTALREGARIFVELYRLGAPLGYFDVGGGLGVDYDGSRSSFQSSVNYSVEEYAADVVAAIQACCDEYEVPHPNVVTESGRAMVAHHAVLVVNVLGVAEQTREDIDVALEESDPDVLWDLAEVGNKVSRKNYQESWHDALQDREEILSRFNLGLLDLQQRAKGERLFWKVATRIEKLLRGASYVPDDMEGLVKTLADTYFCNFSVFQSMPDAWAVEQLFPIVPVQRLNEKPTRQAVIADITCDSDGKIDKFIDLHDVKQALDLHAISEDESYYLAAFLVGAYQEALADLHNLFGDTNVVHIRLDDEEGYHVEHVVEGDTVTEVLTYVQYNTRDLVRRVRQASERAVKKGTMTLDDSKRLLEAYQHGLEGYTYLE